MICEICGKEIEQSKFCSGIICSEECLHEHYWLERVKRKNSKTQAIIDGQVYQIGDENTYGTRGFDGAKFIIEFFDGRKVVTTNLWANGPIPEKFRKKLPDNAVWGKNDEN